MSTENLAEKQMDLTGQRVAVIGLARSGMAAARFLLARGVAVVGADAKPAAELTEEAHQLTELGGEFVPGLTERAQLGTVDLAVISPGVPHPHPILEALRAEGVRVIGETELAYRFCGAPIIAVSGTNGKGSTTVMIGKMLAAAEIPHLVAGNIGLPLISQIDRTHEVAFVVLEVSSFQMESTELFRPYIAILLNISPDHLDRHPDFDSYLHAKSRMFLNQRPSDWALISLDDPGLQPLAADLTARYLSFSFDRREANARVQGEALVVEIEPGAPEVVAQTSDLAVCGTHFVRDALAAALAARLAGASPAAIRAGLRAFEPSDHLLQIVGTVSGVSFVDDSKATNVASALADLECLGRPLIVIAGGLGKNVDFHEFGRRLGEECEAVCLIGESRHLLAEAIGERTQRILCDSLENAVETAFRLAPEGGTVALLPGCASFDMFRDQADRGQVFVRCVRQLSYEYATTGESHNSSGPSA
jgi:UDP-N-acetylmuramoylalanine--D-glutamate ligase